MPITCEHVLQPLCCVKSMLAFAMSGASAPARQVLVSLSKEQQLARYTLDAGSGHLFLDGLTPTPGSPGAMCFNATGDHLYVALREGGIAAFQTDAQPHLLSHVQVNGNPSYLSVHPSGKFLFSACYGEGLVTVHRIQNDGTLATNPIQVIKTDVNAHAAVNDPSGAALFIPHTRPNAIHQFLVDSATGMLRPTDPPLLQREVGTGPRHLWFHPTLSMAYGSDEQNCSITAYRFNTQTKELSVVETLSSLPEEAKGGKNTTSDIEVHPAGRFVYIANRGANTIACLALDAVTGRMKLKSQTAVEPVPRSFNITPNGEFLIAAGQTSGKLRVFRILADGQLEHTQTLRTNGSPWWVVCQP